MNEPVVSVVLLTYNRLGFEQQAVASLLEQADLPFELLIWDNASTDGTVDWLRTLDDPRLRVIYHPENIGLNAYAAAWPMTRGQWLLQLDNDVLQLPSCFMSRMTAAFAACPDLGYLALDVVRDDKTNGNKPEEYAYTEERYGDIVLQFGPVGGWCSMTPRSLYEQVGFPTVEGAKYFYHDGLYNQRLQPLGKRAAILKGVRCYHAVGVYWNARYREYWEEAHAHQPEELRKMRLFVERGVLRKDCVRPWSVRKSLGDAKRFLKRLLKPPPADGTARHGH